LHAAGGPKNPRRGQWPSGIPALRTRSRALIRPRYRQYLRWRFFPYRIESCAAAFYRQADSFARIRRRQAPEPVEIEPLQRRAPAVVFEPQRIFGDQTRECALALPARQMNRFAEQLEMNFAIAPAP